MLAEIVYFNPSIPRVLLSQILQKLWKNVIFSSIGPVIYEKSFTFEIDSPNEILSKTLRGGICGSDLHLVSLDFALDVAPIIVPSPLPRFMGHECVGEIVEIGDDVSKLKKGQRFVVQKGICCYTEQPDNLCPRCSDGNFWLCEKAGLFATKSHYDAAGGWSTGFRYHENQLVVIPNTISSDLALLIEPLACSLRGVLKSVPKEDDKALIIGAGTIGLCTLASLKAVQPDCNITVQARYDFQADFARKLGADDVVQSKDIIGEVQSKTNAELYKGYFGNKTLIGGFDVIYDCIGTNKTVHNSLRWSKGGGKVVLIGIDLKQGKFDFSPIWYQEVDLLGSLIHGVEEWKGERITTYDLVIKMLEEKKINNDIADIITHRFPLNKYKEAIKLAFNKSKNQAMKVIFDYELK